MATGRNSKELKKTKNMEMIDRTGSPRENILTSATESEAAARRHRFARRFARQLIVWAVTCSFLAVVNWQTSPHYWWVLWVIAGWGLQLILSLAFYLFDCDEEETARHD